MAKKKPIPKTVMDLVNRARGGTVVRSYRARQGLPSEVVYHIEPTGKAAPPATTEKAIRLGLLSPIGDGLFEGTSQSWCVSHGV